MNARIVFSALVLGISTLPAAFAALKTECTGPMGANGKVSVILTTAEDDNAEGSASIMIFSGRVTAMPIHLVLTVDLIQNQDSDADVSVKYKDHASAIQMKINDNPALGASYIERLPGLKRLALSCGPAKVSR